ncbi:hypothetical protein F5050DRAFT_1489563 [Lentinula boryana]|uniref:Proteophosphoglycan ppg4 n=1 Tax=Lentinula boryana TaxID=40481 RepID=A0ABQ8QEK5_9AGAR|nr:hypothetical protein F5050DRAFT_1489563 [Lentinula boryana]
MDFEREDSPPPAYSESEYDKKLSSAVQFLAISEATEEEWDDGRSEASVSSGAPQAALSVRNHPIQLVNTSHRAVRTLPVPPREAVANDHPLRIHKKSASHSYALPSVPPSSSDLKWYGGLEEPSSPRNSSRTSRPNAPFSYLENRARSPVASVPSPVVSAPTYPSQHRFSDPKSDHAKFTQSSPMSPLSQSFPARTVSQLNFDASVAYGRSEFSPASAGSTRSEPSHHSHQSFNPNSLYNSAVSSHLHVSSSVPSRLNNPRTPSSRSVSPLGSNALFPAARQPPQNIWTPQISSSPQRPQSPSYSTTATQFPFNPSHITNPSQTAHDRWATSEHQFVHT